MNVLNGTYQVAFNNGTESETWAGTGPESLFNATLADGDSDGMIDKPSTKYTVDSSNLAQSIKDGLDLYVDTATYISTESYSDALHTPSTKIVWDDTNNRLELDGTDMIRRSPRPKARCRSSRHRSGANLGTLAAPRPDVPCWPVRPQRGRA